MERAEIEVLDDLGDADLTVVVVVVQVEADRCEQSPADAAAGDTQVQFGRRLDPSEQGQFRSVRALAGRIQRIVADVEAIEDVDHVKGTREVEEPLRVVADRQVNGDTERSAQPCPQRSENREEHAVLEIECEPRHVVPDEDDVLFAEQQLEGRHRVVEQREGECAVACLNSRCLQTGALRRIGLRAALRDRVEVVFGRPSDRAEGRVQTEALRDRVEFYVRAAVGKGDAESAQWQEEFISQGRDIRQRDNCIERVDEVGHVRASEQTCQIHQGDRLPRKVGQHRKRRCQEIDDGFDRLRDVVDHTQYAAEHVCDEFAKVQPRVAELDRRQGGVVQVLDVVKPPVNV